MDGEFKNRMSSAASLRINELLEKAICKHLGVDKVNIYEHINFMSKQELIASNTTIAFYKGVAIFRMRLVPFSDGRLGFDIEYAFE